MFVMLQNMTGPLSSVLENGQPHAPLNPAWGSFSLLYFWFQSWRVGGLVGEPSALQQPAVHTHSTFFLLQVF